MATQILIYDKSEVYTSSYGVHTVNLINPSFSMSGRETDMGWQCRTTEWQWSGGSGYGEFAYGGDAQPLVQIFPNSLIEDLYYTVGFTVSNFLGGSFRVYMGSQPIADISSNGSHEITYYSSSGTGLASQIAFFPNPSFLGRIDDVFIRQNEELSPPAREFRYEPIGLLDMYDEERIGVTYKVSDIRTPSKRFGAFSTSFALPGTSHNKKLLGHLQSNEATYDGFDARQKWKCELISDDVTVVRGFMILSDVTTTGEETVYNVEILDDTLGFLSSIKSKKLAELDLSLWDHRLTHKFVTNTWKSDWTWNGGYWYPFLLQPTEATHEVNRDMRPAFSVRGLFDKIIRGAGYSYHLSPLVEEKMNESYHLPVGPRPKGKLDDLALYNVEAESNVGQVWSVASDYVFNGPINANSYAARWQANVEVVDQMSLYDPASPNYTFVVPYTGEYDVTLSASTHILFATPWDFTNSYHPQIVTNGTPGVHFSIMDIDTNIVLLDSFWALPSQLDVPLSFDHVFRISGQTLNLIAGQTLAIRGYIDNATYDHINNANDYFRYRPDITVTMDDSESFISYAPAVDSYVVGENFPIRATEWISDRITQETFVNDMIKAFNLMFIPDPNNERHLLITSRNELYDTTDIIDRSGHVAMDEPIVREQFTQLSSSVVRFSYDESDETFNEEYERLTFKKYGEHEWTYDTDLYNGKEEVQLAVYTPTPITRDGSSRVVPAIFGLDEEGKNESRWLVRGEQINTAVNIRYHDPILHETTEYEFPYHRLSIHSDGIGTGSTYDLNYGEVDASLTNVSIDLTSNNLFNAHWGAMLREYDEGRVFTVMMRLSVHELREHIENLGARVWIEELGGWFILLEITHFDPTLGDRSLTKVQLLQVGPSVRRVNQTFTYVLEPGLQVNNPFTPGSGSLPSPIGETVNEVRIGTQNVNNGNNSVKGLYNTVNGSGNTVFGDYNSVVGLDNTIGAGLSGVTLLGANGYSATTSNTTVFSSLGSFSPSGATFYGDRGWSLGRENASFYSGVTISRTGATVFEALTSAVTVNGITYTASTANTYHYGGLTLGQSGITIGGISNTGSTLLDPWTMTVTGITLGDVIISRSGMTNSGGTSISVPMGTDGEMLYNSGGTWVHRDMGIRFDGSYDPITNDYSGATVIGYLYGHTASTTSYQSSIFGGSDNILSGETLWATIGGGYGNMISGSVPKGVQSIFGSSTCGIYNSSESGIYGGKWCTISNSMYSFILGSYQSNITVGENLGSGIVGGWNNAFTITTSNYSVLVGGVNNRMGRSSGGFVAGGGDNFHDSSVDSAIVAGTGNTVYSTFGSAILASDSSDILVAYYSTILGGSQNKIDYNDSVFPEYFSTGSTIIGGSRNTISGITNATIIGGTNNSILDGFSGESSTIISCSGVTSSKAYTTYVNDLDIQNIIDLKPRSSFPAVKDGRVFYSAHTGLMICVNTTWKLVTAV